MTPEQQKELLCIYGYLAGVPARSDAEERLVYAVYSVLSVEIEDLVEPVKRDEVIPNCGNTGSVGRGREVLRQLKPLTSSQLVALLPRDRWLLLDDADHICPGCAEVLQEDLLSWNVIGSLNDDTPDLLCCNCDLAENITGRSGL